MDQQHDPTTRPLRFDGARPGDGDRGSTTYRYVVVAAATLVALAVVALVGVLLYPRVAPVAATVAAPAVAAAPVPSPGSTPTSSTSTSAPTVVRVPRTVIVPAPTTTDDVPAGGYSCGSAGGYAVHVNNGNVPCTSARLVTSQWTTFGTTPMNGEGDAGTPYSWTCTSAPAAVGFCVSKLGSTFTIDY